jgi:hypothetical protein
MRLASCLHRYAIWITEVILRHKYLRKEHSTMRTIRTLAIAVLGSAGMFLATGCAAERNKDIPAEAKLVSQGEKDLTYRTPDDGKVWIFDKNTQSVLYSSKLDKDQVIKVDAMHDKITVDDRTVLSQKIHDHAAMNIFFEREPSPRVTEVQPAQHTIIREREVQTAPRSDSNITVSPNKDRVTVEGGADSKVTVEPKSGDSKVTIEPAAGQK